MSTKIVIKSKMIKKSLVIGLSFILLFMAYLWIVNWSIYYRIGAAGLKAVDSQKVFVFNSELGNEADLVYVALGDSLTAGAGASSYDEYYPYLVAKQMANNSKRVTYYNESYLGAKTSDLIRDLLAKGIAKNPDVVTVLIGTNDAHDNISDEEFRRNYEKIISDLKNQTKAKINVVSIPFIGARSLFLPPFYGYYQFKVTNFNKIIKELALKYNVNYIDLTTPTAQYCSADSSYYSADAFHPSSIGYKYWSQIIYDNLNK